MPVTREPPEVRGPHRVWLTNQSEIPADRAARRRHDRSLVPEVLVDPLNRTAVGDDCFAIECPEQEVGYMPGRWLPRGQASSNGCPAMPVTRASRSASTR